MVVRVFYPTGGGAGTSVEVATTGWITSGNITVGNGAFTSIGGDLTVAAAAGDVLEITPDILMAAGAAEIQFEAATIVSASVANYWSSGTGTSRWPGGVPAWYVLQGFNRPNPSRYTAQAGDISAGAVTVRLLARMAAGTRDVLASSSYPASWWLTNLGPG